MTLIFFGGGGRGWRGEMENCAYLRKNPGYAPENYSLNSRKWLFSNPPIIHSVPLSPPCFLKLFTVFRTERAFNNFEWRSNYISPHVSTESVFRNPGKFVCGIRNQMGCGTGNTAQGIRNLTYNWNPATKFHFQRLESMQYLMRLGSWHALSANRSSYQFYRLT